MTLAGTAGPSHTPRTWLLASPHAGDITQQVALARALAWPFETRKLTFRWFEKILRPLRLASPLSLDTARSDSLAGPPPELIILSGRPNEAIAFWLKKTRAPAAKLVFIGTPAWPLEDYDLVITTPQYGLPHRPNIVHNRLPLHGVTPAALAAAAQAWAPRLHHLPQHRVALLVGGSSGPYVFTAESAARLAVEASALASARKAALLVTTSARTPPAAGAALEAGLTVPAHVHRWQPGQSDNPFMAFLALADEIIVTADSVSMIAEACATGKPVHLFDIESGRRAMRAEEASPPGTPPHWRGRNVQSTAFRLVMRFCPPRWSRDLRVVHHQVVETGQASWLGAPGAGREGAPAAASDLEQSLLRIRALFGL